MAQAPKNIVEIVADGDVILVLHMSDAPGTPIGLQVSTHALTLASPVFKKLLAEQTQTSTEEPTIALPEEDGDAMYILTNILHLRNDKLPARLSPDMLRRLGLLAQKFDCVIAAGRATAQWFDRLYFSSDTETNVWAIIEAAYLFDEATFFTRFTSAWILKADAQLGRKQIPLSTTRDNMQLQRLAFILAERHSQAQILLRNDIDSLVDACAFVFSEDHTHYIDFEPGSSPEPDELPPGASAVTCHVDDMGAMEYLGALRDARIWLWNGTATIGDIVQRIKAFQAPEYDDCDKCSFCEEVKFSFTTRLGKVKEMGEKRLWGLCLDCYKAGGVNQGECRYEHPEDA